MPVTKPSSLKFRAFVLGAALFGAACGANLAPVLNVEHAPLAGTPAGTEPSAHAHEAILRAVRSRGWTVAADAPGVVTASIEKGALAATVDIPYTASDYSIIHKSSSPALKFDGTRIHKHYNLWVDRLRASINEELSRAPSVPAPTPPPPAKPTT
jgi:hypothetical protein